MSQTLSLVLQEVFGSFHFVTIDVQARGLGRAAAPQTRARPLFFSRSQQP